MEKKRKSKKIPRKIDSRANKPITRGELGVLLQKQTENIISVFDKRFEQVDKRFDTVDKRFKSIDERFEQVDKRFDTVDKRFKQVDKRFKSIDERFDMMDLKLSEQTARINALDEKFERKFNQLITTLDGFLKRMTDVETEYEMMKVDINRIKVVVKEKLGVDLL